MYYVVFKFIGYVNKSLNPGAFQVFDHENNNTVDAREIGTIIRETLILRYDLI